MRTLDHALPPMGMWAIEPQAGAERLAYLRTIDTFSHLKQWAMARKEALALGNTGGQKEAPPLYTVQGHTAFFAISGTLTPEPHSFSDFDDALGGSNYRDIVTACQQMQADTSVKNVFCDFDTPGGTVDKCYEAWEALSALNKEKPIHAYVDQACSAGLWLLTACEYATGNIVSEVGSMGGRMSLLDLSKLYEMEGVEAVPIDTSGPDGYKSAGLEGTPITPEQKAMFQRWVQACCEPFFASVKKRFALSDAQMKAVSSAEVYVGPKAKSMGLLDSIGSRSEAIGQMQTRPKRRPRPAKPGASLTQPAQICALYQEALMSDETISPEQQAHARKGFLEMLFGSHKATATAAANLSALDPSGVMLAGYVPAAGPTEREKQLEAELLQSRKDANAEAITQLAALHKFTPAAKSAHEAVRFACVQQGKEAVAAYNQMVADMAVQTPFAETTTTTRDSVDADTLADKVNGDGKDQADPFDAAMKTAVNDRFPVKG